jgi:uridylate kinase
MLYTRILLKLSGESLAGDNNQGINSIMFCMQYAEQIAAGGCRRL